MGKIETDYYEKEKKLLYNDGTIIRAAISIYQNYFTSLLSSEDLRELKQIVLDGKSIKRKLSVEELLKLLEEKKNEQIVLDINDIDSILNFILEGDSELSRYSEYIIMKIKEVNEESIKDETLVKIGELVNNIYVDTEEKNFLMRIVNPKSRNIKREVNQDILDELTGEINNHIKSLVYEVKKYRSVYNAITMYIKAIEKYRDCVQSAYEHYLKQQNIVDCLSH